MLRAVRLADGDRRNGDPALLRGLIHGLPLSLLLWALIGLLALVLAAC